MVYQVHDCVVQTNGLICLYQQDGKRQFRFPRLSTACGTRRSATPSSSPTGTPRAKSKPAASPRATRTPRAKSKPTGTPRAKSNHSSSASSPETFSQRLSRLFSVCVRQGGPLLRGNFILNKEAMISLSMAGRSILLRSYADGLAGWCAPGGRGGLGIFFGNVLQNRHGF